MEIAYSHSHTENIHAGCILWNEVGILIRGASGIGKSTLARMILWEAERNNEFACLVSDDRTLLSRHNNRLIAKPVPILAGKLEIRGCGIVDIPFEEAAIVHLVVEMVNNKALLRVAEPQDLGVSLLGITLPYVTVTLDGGAISAISKRLNLFCTTTTKK